MAAVQHRAATDLDRFNAAVKIVQSLPKDGPFQPSNELKLQFYAYYKQATLGVCKQPKPAFWDIVNKAKWQAWQSLGSMSKEAAMQGYVNSMREIIDSMPFETNVQEFYDACGDLLDFVSDKREHKGKDLNGYVPNGHGAGDGPSKSYPHSFDRRIAHEKPLDETQNASVASLTNGFHASISTDRLAKLQVPADKSIVDGMVASTDSFVDFCGHHGEEPGSENEDLFSDALEPEEPSQDAPATPDVESSVTDGIDESTFAALSSPVTPVALTKSQRAVQRTLPKKFSFNRHLQSLNRGMPPAQNYDEIFNEAWSAVQDLKLAREKTLVDQRRMLKNLQSTLSTMSKSTNKTRKAKGANDSGASKSGTTQPDSSSATNAGQSSQQTSAQSASVSSQQQQRSRSTGRNSSGSSSSSVELIEFDPHVSAVLVKMHEELRNIATQLELMEGIMLNQQHMIADTLALVNKKNTFRLGVFPQFPWRTILFILLWPFVASILMRVASRSWIVAKLLRRRR